MSKARELQILLVGMDVPFLRRDTSKPENVEWLRRNLGIQNKAHTNFSLAEELIKALSRENSNAT